MTTTPTHQLDQCTNCGRYGWHTTDKCPDVPVPPGARPDTWEDDSPLPYRVLFGELRGIDGVDTDRVNVQPTAVQFSDGRIDDGSVHEPPHIYVGDNALTTTQARELAATLNDAADEADRWAAK
jgi:hypothetical protein